MPPHPDPKNAPQTPLRRPPGAVNPPRRPSQFCALLGAQRGFRR